MTVNELNARVNEISNARQSVASTSLHAGLNGIYVYLVNIQCLLARLPELCFQLESH